MRNKIAKCIPGFTLLLALVACAGGPHPSYPPTVPSTSTLEAIPPDALVIINGLVIDGTGSAPILDGMVATWGTLIVAVGPKENYVIPSEVELIDALGGTILPGIINAHTHGTADPATRRFSFLLKGVTSTCDLGAPLESMSQFGQDDTAGPSARGFRAGPIITAPGGYADVAGQGRHLNYEVANPDEARAAVVDLVNRGADFIKIALEPGPAGVSWPMLSLQQVTAIVEEAHARGRLVRAHLTRANLLEMALKAQVDVIEHVPVPQLTEADWRAATVDKDHLILPAEYEAQLARMMEQHVVMVPTLSVTPAICDMNWYGMPAEFQPLCGKLFLEVVHHFHDLGGMVALGNDYGNQGAEPGMPLREMQLLMQAGLQPMEVIQAGTAQAATVCGHGDELGTLELSKLADLIIVDGNPLADIEAMTRVVTVIKAGEVIDLRR
jgi:imidazolonepropionase-like amidohydrolase